MGTQPVVQHCLQYLASRCGLHAQQFVSLPSLCHLYQCRQWLHSSQGVAHGSEATKGKETITVTFHDDKDGSTKTVQVPVGMSLLEAAHANDVDLEGACEGSLACSTCHVILEDPEVFARLPEPTDDENDMLDLAFGLTDLSRLGCQIIASKDIDGIVVKIPSATRNFAVDGHIPKPH